MLPGLRGGMVGVGFLNSKNLKFTPTGQGSREGAVNKKFSHFLGTFCLAAIFGLFALSNIKAQVISGDLVGTVLDKSGAAVPGATIDAVKAGTGVKHTTKANEAGEYRFTNLPVGAYNVSASAASFATTTISGFHVELNKTVTLPITLEVKGVSNTIEVSGAAQPLETPPRRK